ncbi:MAG: DUF3332 domain-containing protein [Bacteroidaceae bacterium]|nr:DUF3332 domain-containing protein [Bacteroidaceae bacterium]
MKKYFKFSALLLSAAIVLSSCIGSFKLTNNIKDWNETVSTKWVNEVVFLALHIVPVYPIAMMVDGVVLNSMEFWTGENLVIEKGEKKVVENSNGETVEITALENGYNITNGVTSMNLVFDEAERVWSAEYDNQTTKLVKLVDDNNAQMYLAGGEVMDVTRDQISSGFALK